MFPQRLLFALCVIKFSEIITASKFAHSIDRMGACTGPEFAHIESPFTNIKFTKINRTTKILSCGVTWKRPIDEKTGVSMDVDKITSGGLRKIPFFPFIPDPCKIFLKNFNQIWVQLMTSFGIKNPDQCPIPPGNYTMKNFVLDSEVVDSNGIPIAGKFRLRITIVDLETKKIISCMEVLTDSYEV